MSTVLWIAATLFALAFGAWVYAKSTHAERKAGRDALEAKWKETQRQQEEGRRKNEEAVRRKEVVEILEWILRDPEVLKRRHYPDVHQHVTAPALYELARNVKALENLSQRVVFAQDSSRANAEALRNIRETQKDIMKALQMGQPVE